MRARSIIVVTLACLAAAPAGAAEVKVLASTAIKSSLEALAPQYEKASEDKLTITYGASARLKPAIEGGEAFDLAILAAAVTDALVKAGKLAPQTRIVARSGAGVAVRQGAPRPEVGSVEAFKRTLLAAKAVGYSDTGAGSQFLTAMFEHLRIAEAMRPKLTRARQGQTSLQALAAGLIDLDLPQISEAMAAPGVDLVGPLPAELQVYTVLPAALASGALNPKGAQALLDFLGSPAAVAVIKAKGLEPGP
jgi:molybdate transport system substrate-binding protein